jgi:hypothetical protein
MLHGMKPLQMETTGLALVLLAALAAWLAFVVWWQPTQIVSGRQFEFPDSQSYWELGQHMASRSLGLGEARPQPPLK